MPKELVLQKTDQAVALLRELDIDCWLTFVRETKMMQDPAVSFVAGMGVVGFSAFILTSHGEKIAILASFDTVPFEEQGVYTEILPYTTSIREPLRETLRRLDPAKIALNYAPDDCAADGLTLGMYRKLQELLEGTDYTNRFVSSEPILSAVRGIKTTEELRLMREAAEETLEIFGCFEERIRKDGLAGWTTDRVEAFFRDEVVRRGWDFSWDRSSDPSLTSGPDCTPGHGTTPGIPLSPGHVLRIDFGIVKNGYSSDLQRTWYVFEKDEAKIPADVQRPFDVVLQGIHAAKAFLRPGVAGWEVDAVARKIVMENGFEEFDHSLGHQIGTLAHDGGGGLSPRWERYGKKPYDIVREGQAYTLEFGLPTPRGWVSLEEMVVVTANGCEYVVPPQERIRALGSGT